MALLKVLTLTYLVVFNWIFQQIVPEASPECGWVRTKKQNKFYSRAGGSSKDRSTCFVCRSCEFSAWHLLHSLLSTVTIPKLKIKIVFQLTVFIQLSGNNSQLNFAQALWCYIQSSLVNLLIFILMCLLWFLKDPPFGGSIPSLPWDSLLYSRNCVIEPRSPSQPVELPLPPRRNLFQEYFSDGGHFDGLVQCIDCGHLE